MTINGSLHKTETVQSKLVPKMVVFGKIWL